MASGWLPRSSKGAWLGSMAARHVLMAASRESAFSSAPVMGTVMVQGTEGVMGKVRVELQGISA